VIFRRAVHREHRCPSGDHRRLHDAPESDDGRAPFVAARIFTQAIVQARSGGHLYRLFERQDRPENRDGVKVAALDSSGRIAAIRRPAHVVSEADIGRAGLRQTPLRPRRFVGHMECCTPYLQAVEMREGSIPWRPNLVASWRLGGAHGGGWGLRQLKIVRGNQRVVGITTRFFTVHSWCTPARG
jgi:hypothetical protein